MSKPIATATDVREASLLFSSQSRAVQKAKRKDSQQQLSSILQLHLESHSRSC